MPGLPADHPHADRDRAWYDEQDRLQRLDAERLAEYDAQEVSTRTKHPHPCHECVGRGWVADGPQVNVKATCTRCWGTGRDPWPYAGSSLEDLKMPGR